MGNLLDILTYVAPPVLMLLLGAMLRRAGWFKAEADASVSVLTVRVLSPCFFFYHMLGAMNKWLQATWLLLWVAVSYL